MLYPPIAYGSMEKQSYKRDLVYPCSSDLFEIFFCTFSKTYNTLYANFSNISLKNKLLRVVPKALKKGPEPEQELEVALEL